MTTIDRPVSPPIASAPRQARIRRVAEGVVAAYIHEIAPAPTNSRRPARRGFGRHARTETHV